MTGLRFAVTAPLLALGCSPSAPPPERGNASVPAVSAARAAQSFPYVGLAVLDTVGRWCAAFPSPAPLLAAGTRVTIVFAELAGPREPAAWGASVERLRDAECPAGFAQSRWVDYRAYDIALIDTLRPEAADVPLATLAVASDVSWTRGADGRVRADLDGDGSAEEARVCRADEGEHFTIWSGSEGTRRRRAHEYYDWGAFVDPSCAAEESEDGPDSGAP